MLRKLMVFVVVGVLAAAFAPAARAGSDARGQYIVVLDPAVADPGSLASEHERSHGAEISHVYRFALKGYAASMTERAAQQVALDDRVQLVELDRAVQATGHSATNLGKPPTGVHRAYAPHNAEVGIDGIDDQRVDVDVAIIDTGIDTSHADLNLAGGKNCQNGPSYDDGNGHGTHVAGTAAGLDNGNGVVGMAPGARLWAVRVLDNSGSGSWSTVICGIDWVTANASTIEVANMSLAGSGSDGPCDSSSLHLAICNSVGAGVTYAVAAGNETDDTANHVPAAYDEVITVSALADFDGEPGGAGLPTCRTDLDDTFANFSNFGDDVDLIAPGVCIKSTWKDGGYNTISGTSMASPHVAGAAALYKATNPTASPATVQAALQSEGNYVWSNLDDGDATQEPLLDVSDALVFNPVMVGTGSGGGGGGEPIASFTLSATGYKVKGTKKVDLTWSGSSASSVEVYRNGAKVTTTPNDGAHTDTITQKGGGSYTYKLCDAGSTTTCSNEATVTF